MVSNVRKLKASLLMLSLLAVLTCARAAWLAAAAPAGARRKLVVHVFFAY